MKKLLFAAIAFMAICANAQNGQIYSLSRISECARGECISGYTFFLTGFDAASICYVVDDGTLPVNVIENISEYCGDTVIMCIDTAMLETFSVFLESTRYSITIKQWLCVHPEGNSNTLIFNNFNDNWKRYVISDPNGRVISKGTLKEKNLTMVNLKGSSESEYYIEFVSNDGKTVYCKTLTMNWI